MVPVALRGICKSYDGATPVLADVDLDIAAGEMFFLLGGSGCGKTTLLRLVAGFLAPDRGRILFDGQDVTGLPPERRDIGMVFQNYALWPHLDVGANVAFGLDVRGVARDEKRRRVDEVLAQVELPGYAARRIDQLSGGQQQRVALARALVIRPKVLLLDEPLSNLDARLRVQMRSGIRAVCKAAGVTAIYVTHDQHEALSTADRIALLAGGAVAQVGTPRQIHETPASRAVAEFIGEANLLPATVVGPGRVGCALGDLDTLPVGAATGAPMLVCLRPERIRIGPVPGDPGSTNVFSGTISAQSYLGDSALWTVLVGGQAISVKEAAPPPRALGERIALHVAPADVVVLPP